MSTISKQTKWFVSLIFVLLISNVAYAKECQSGQVKVDISSGNPKVAIAVLCPGASMQVLLPRHSSFRNIMITFFTEERLTRSLQTSTTASKDITGPLAEFLRGNDKIFSVELKNATSERVSFFDKTSLFNTGEAPDLVLTNVNNINVELYVRPAP